MKVILVTQRVDFLSDINEMRDSLDQRLILFLQMAGYLPVPVPNIIHNDINYSFSNSLFSWIEALNPSGFVLSGGNDIGSMKMRDITELKLLDFAKLNNLPVLGICRGMQLLAHWSGVGLKLVNDHLKTRHNIVGSFTKSVNSFHRYSLLSCPNDFEVLAFSEDGEIEAIRHLYLPWEGWMWHPERDEIYSSDDIVRLINLFN
jgi:putative glutamine amidotransferase